MIELVTFDAAGTLLEYRSTPGALAARMARERGYDLSDEAGEALFQRIESSLRREREEAEKARDRVRVRAVWLKMAEEWLRQTDGAPERASDWLDEFLERMFAGEGGGFAPYEDAAPTLRELRGAGIRVGVLSNWDHTLHLVLKRTGLEELLDFAIASLEFGVEKPDPAIFNEALRQGGASPRTALHVGDDFADDYEGAKKAGWHALLLERSAKASTNGTIRSLTEVSERIRQWT